MEEDWDEELEDDYDDDDFDIIDDLDELDLFGEGDESFVIKIDREAEDPRPRYVAPTGEAKTRQIVDILSHAEDGMIIGSKGGFKCKEIQDRGIYFKFSGFNAECVWDLEESLLMITELRASPKRRFYSGDDRSVIFDNEAGLMMNIDFSCNINEDCNMSYTKPDLVQTDHESKRILYDKQKALLKIEINGSENGHWFNFETIKKEEDEK